jgi:acyl carrier protein
MSVDPAISARVKDFILAEFLPGEDAAELTGSTGLISSGVLDSLAVLKLVSFLEESFGIEVAAHEADADHLDTLDDITKLVMAKTQG